MLIVFAPIAADTKIISGHNLELLGTLFGTGVLMAMEHMQIP